MKIAKRGEMEARANHRLRRDNIRPIKVGLRNLLAEISGEFQPIERAPIIGFVKEAQKELPYLYNLWRDANEDGYFVGMPGMHEHAVNGFSDIKKYLRSALRLYAALRRRRQSKSASKSGRKSLSEQSQADVKQLVRRLKLIEGWLEKKEDKAASTNAANIIKPQAARSVLRAALIAAKQIRAMDEDLWRSFMMDTIKGLKWMVEHGVAASTDDSERFMTDRLFGGTLTGIRRVITWMILNGR
jgi:hypothetical protein